MERTTKGYITTNLTEMKVFEIQCEDIYITNQKFKRDHFFVEYLEVI